MQRLHNALCNLCIVSGGLPESGSSVRSAVGPRRIIVHSAVSSWLSAGCASQTTARDIFDGMRSATEEDRILELAVSRGVLRAVDILPSAYSPAMDSPRYGPRLDVLILNGRLAESLVRELLNEVATDADTQDGRSRPPLATEPHVTPQWAATTATIPPYLVNWDRYAVEGCLGQGGMGVVYKAHDRKLGRTVALKFMHHCSPDQAQRFLREARAQARIQNPGICQVFEAAEHGGRPYIAMEYVEGQPLHQAQGRMALEEKAYIARDLAVTLQAAHSRGIIHRDIKPHNLLVRQHEDGRWYGKVLDFGLARDVTAAEGLTVSGAVMGTPAYMSPEQARGERATLDRRTDVYSLGAVIYHLLTGEPPFSGDSLSGTLLRVIQEDPLPPRKWVPQIPADLELITLKCMRKEPHQRYESAQALADDLDRYLSGAPVWAASWSWLYQLRRRANRHRARLGVVAIALLSLAGLAGMEVRSRQLADRRARLAHELGREVELNEMFLRAAYMLPLHEVQRERHEVQERIQRIEQQLAAMNHAEAALAHHALGRGYLALRRFEQAASHLREALRDGLTDDNVQFSLGLALGAQYQLAMQQVERQGDPDWREARKQELRGRYLEPAQASFRQSRATLLETADYATAQIMFFRDDYEQARTHAAAALAKQPWRFEIQKLLGDIDQGRGMQKLAQGQYAEARIALQGALASYQAAAQVARSDGALQLALADVWTRQMQLEMLQGESPEAAAEQALAACARVSAIEPEDSSVYQVEYNVRYSLAYYHMEHGQNPAPDLTQALGAVERGIGHSPQNPFFYDAAATVLGLQAKQVLDRGGDAEVLITQASAYLQKSLALNPNIARTWSDRGGLSGLRCKQQIMRGLACQVYFREALADWRRARELSPLFAANELLFRGLASYAQHLIQQGESPQFLVTEGASWAAEAVRLKRDNFITHQGMGALYLVVAEHALSSHAGADLELVAAEQELSEARRLNPNAAEIYAALARLHRLRAQGAEAQGQSAAALWQQALTEAEHGIKLNPDDPNAQQERRAVLGEMQRAARQQRAPGPDRAAPSGQGRSKS